MAGMATCTLTHLIEVDESRDIVRRLIEQTRRATGADPRGASTANGRPSGTNAAASVGRCVSDPIEPAI